MKKHFFLLGILFLESIVFVNAQLTTNSNEYQSALDTDNDIEFVTVGSVMPYNVSPFNWGALKDMMNTSVFKWWLNGNATGYELRKTDGSTPLKPLPPPDNVYYPDSAIAIHWTKTGKYTLRVSEKSMFKSGISGCDQNESFQTLDIIVFDKPFAAWKEVTETEGCNLAGSIQNVALEMKGIKSIVLSCEVIYTSPDGFLTDTTEINKSFKPDKDEELFTDTIQINIPENKFGTYKLFIRNIQDKVSAKSGVKSGTGDIPPVPFVLKAFPEPEPGPVRMLKVLN